MKTAAAALKSIVHRAICTLFVIVILGAAIAASPEAAAQQRSGCFAAKDHLGYPAKVFVKVERYRDWFEITGQIHSTGAGRIYRFKADGYSGKGRLYERHEYESGAVYIDVQLTETDFVLQVESYGVFHFRRVRC